MHQNGRSLLDFAPAEPQRVDHAYAPEKQHFEPTSENIQPQQKRGLKSFVDAFSRRQKNQDATNDQDVIEAKEDLGQRNHAADFSDHTPPQAPQRNENNNQRQQEFYHDPDKPLLDFVAIVMSVWNRKFLIVTLGFIGAVIGVLIALSTPHKYYAESQIFLDPRELRLTDTDLSNNPVSSELLLALVDTQMRVATSTTVLENTIDELGLASDPEFNGSGGGISAALKELFSSSTGASTDVNKRVLDQLRKSIGVGRDPKTLVVSLGVSTLNAEKSAVIANSLVEQFLKEFSLQKSGFFTQTSSSIQSRLDVLGMRLDEAENAIVKYRSVNDIIDVGGGVINQKEMLSLSDSLTKIRADQIAKSILAEELSKVDVNAVISGSFPQAALTTTLSEQRKQYSVAKSTSDSLAVGLGPRHPKLVAAQASAKALEADIRDELRRIIAAAQRDAKRTQQSEAELSSQLAVLKSRSSDQSVENIELEELTRKANSLRSLYEQLLRSSSETAVQGELSSSKIQVISRAEPPDIPSSTSRKITVILFAFAGAMLGFIYAVMVGAWRGIQQGYTTERPSSRMSVAAQPYQQPEQTMRKEEPAPRQQSYAHDEPVMRAQQPAGQYHGQVAGQRYEQAMGQAAGHAYSSTPVAEPQMQAHPQPYVDPRMMPVVAYPAPLPPQMPPQMPQAVYANGQPAHVYQNVMPQPVAAQHVFVQPYEQQAPAPTPVPIAKPHVEEVMSPAPESDDPEGRNSSEYQRLHNEVQRVRARLENWVDQNNRDVRNR